MQNKNKVKFIVPLTAFWRLISLHMQKYLLITEGLFQKLNDSGIIAKLFLNVNSSIIEQNKVLLQLQGRHVQLL